MLCPHVKVTSQFSSAASYPGVNTLACRVCKSRNSPWMCTNCGLIHCGRYVNGHAKEHAKEKNHLFSIDCHALTTYCYNCDEYITNCETLPPEPYGILNKFHSESCDISNGVPEDSAGLKNGISGRMEYRRCSARLNCKEKWKDSVKMSEDLSEIGLQSKRRRTGNIESVGDNQSNLTCNTDLISNEGLSNSKLIGGNLHKKIVTRSKNTNSIDESNSNSSSNSNYEGNSTKTGVVGLRNLGNTCFMNAVLQSLSKIKEFSCYMTVLPLEKARKESKREPIVYITRARKNGLLSSKNNKNDTIKNSSQDENKITDQELLTEELRKILISLNSNCSSTVSPDSLFAVLGDVMPRFRDLQQHDAHEFLRYMLDRVHVELTHLIPKFSWNGIGLDWKRSKDENHRSSVNNSERNSIVTCVFGGSIQNEVRCTQCNVGSTKIDPFLDLSLEISGANGCTSLQHCLSRFVDVEELNDGDMYYCSNCKTNQISTKKFWICRLPNVLCLHLKRFRWSQYLRTKLDQYVEFPLTDLDMSSYSIKTNGKSQPSSCLYDLNALIVHHGSGVGSGHYTAFAKKEQQWYHFNDSNVKPIEESQVAKSKAYILFYTRREFKI